MKIHSNFFIPTIVIFVIFFFESKKTYLSFGDSIDIIDKVKNYLIVILNNNDRSIESSQNVGYSNCIVFPDILKLRNSNASNREFEDESYCYTSKDNRFFLDITT
jgi:hypothetical protein